MDILSFAGELISSLARHGWSVTTLVVALTALLRVNAVRKMLLRRLPKRFRQDDRIERLELKVDALLAAGGVKWNAVETNYTASMVKASWISSLWARLNAQSARKYTMRRNLKMNKFKSRKFWMSIIAALLVVANEGLDLGISTETVMTFAALVASFIFSEAYVDGKKNPEVSTYDAKTLDSVRQDSEGA